VPGEGPLDARVFFVGQAPGAEEARTGRPFVGRAGRFFDRALEAAGLSRPEIFITSVEKHFPPRNRAPTRAEIAACKPWLLEQLARVDPEVVVLMGRVAEAAVARDAALKGRRVLVTVHPAAAMRFPGMRRRFQRDLARLTRAGGARRRPGRSASVPVPLLSASGSSGAARRPSAPLVETARGGPGAPAFQRRRGRARSPASVRRDAGTPRA
jgi:uracil-DNA glycosylase family 4